MSKLGCNTTTTPYKVQALVMEDWMIESGDEVSRHSRAVLEGYNSRVPCNGVCKWRRSTSKTGERGDRQADASHACTCS